MVNRCSLVLSHWLTNTSWRPMIDCNLALDATFDTVGNSTRHVIVVNYCPWCLHDKAATIYSCQKHLLRIVWTATSHAPSHGTHTNTYGIPMNMILVVRLWRLTLKKWRNHDLSFCMHSINDGHMRVQTLIVCYHRSMPKYMYMNGCTEQRPSMANGYTTMGYMYYFSLLWRFFGDIWRSVNLSTLWFAWAYIWLNRPRRPCMERDVGKCGEGGTFCVRW